MDLNLRTPGVNSRTRPLDQCLDRAESRLFEQALFNVLYCKSIEHRQKLLKQCSSLEDAMSWYVECLKKYAVFSGRARRKEYWMFMLFHALIVMVLSIVDGLSGAAGGASVFGTLYQLAALLPALAAGVRRMHDTDHSGWWLFVPGVSLIFALRAGHDGDNRFGPDPKATQIRLANSQMSAANA